MKTNGRPRVSVRDNYDIIVIVTERWPTLRLICSSDQECDAWMDARQPHLGNHTPFDVLFEHEESGYYRVLLAARACVSDRLGPQEQLPDYTKRVFSLWQQAFPIPRQEAIERGHFAISKAHGVNEFGEIILLCRMVVTPSGLEWIKVQMAQDEKSALKTPPH